MGFRIFETAAITATQLQFIQIDGCNVRATTWGGKGTIMMNHDALLGGQDDVWETIQKGTCFSWMIILNSKKGTPLNPMVFRCLQF